MRMDGARRAASPEFLVQEVAVHAWDASIRPDNQFRRNLVPGPERCCDAGRRVATKNRGWGGAGTTASRRSRVVRVDEG